MKTKIYKDELWPHYSFSDMNDSSVFTTEVDLPSKEIKRMEKVIVAFFDVRAELEALYEGAENKEEKKDSGI